MNTAMKSINAYKLIYLDQELNLALLVVCCHYCSLVLFVIGTSRMILLDPIASIIAILFIAVFYLLVHHVSRLRIMFFFSCYLHQTAMVHYHELLFVARELISHHADMIKLISQLISLTNWRTLCCLSLQS